MPDLVSHLLPIIESFRPPLIPTDTQAVYPNYQAGTTLASLPASICRWLDAGSFGLPSLAQPYLHTLDEKYRNVILVLVDGLGLDWFLRYTAREQEKPAHERIWSNLLADALIAPLTSIVPSTTSSALTTLWTGETTLRHAITGYESWLKEYGVVANMITHAPMAFQGDNGSLRRAGFDPATFLNLPTLGTHLEQFGVKTFGFLHAAIARSGLSTMHMPQVNVKSFRTTADLWYSFSQFLSGENYERSYIYIYWGELDELSHLYGPDNERVYWEFESFSRLFERFVRLVRQNVKGRTLLILTADHGEIATPRYTCYDLKNHPDVMDCLVMATGEARFAYLYVRPGKEEKLRQLFAERWGERFRLYPAEQLLQAGLFGPGQPAPRTLERIGDWVAIAQDNAYLWWANKENILLGRHGALTRAEMLTPFIALPL